MQPLFKIFIGLIGFLAINELTKEKAQISGIRKENVDYKFLRIVKRSDDLSAKKRVITRDVENIISKHREFKIGETGGNRQRANNYQGFSKMYLLAESKSAGLIDELEEYYIEKYHSHSKNKNINKGSASVMQSKDGRYFMYCVVN